MELKKSLIYYFTATFALSWLCWLPALLDACLGAAVNDVLLKIGTFIPAIVGLLLAMITGGKREFTSMLRSMIRFRGKPIWVLFTFLVMPFSMGIAYFVFRLTGGTVDTSNFSLPFIVIAFFLIFFLMGPLGEEAGWRGFALKRFLTYMSPLKSGVILGSIWAVWHIPLFFISGTVQNDLLVHGVLIALLGYIVYTVMISLLITLVYIKTKGSLLAVMIFHTLSNLVLGVAPIFLLTQGAIIYLGVLAVVFTVVIVMNAKTLTSDLSDGAEYSGDTI